MNKTQGRIVYLLIAFVIFISTLLVITIYNSFQEVFWLFALFLLIVSPFILIGLSMYLCYLYFPELLYSREEDIKKRRMEMRRKKEIKRIRKQR